jgi:hypothetical protein
MRNHSGGGQLVGRPLPRHFVSCVLLVLTLSSSTVGQVSPIEQFDRDLTAWIKQNTSFPYPSDLITFGTPLPFDPALNSGGNVVKRTLLLLTDTVPKPMSRYFSSGRTTYVVYQAILDNGRPQPNELSDLDKKLLRSAERTLLRKHCPFIKLVWRLRGKSFPREPSRKYLKYRDYSRLYAKVATRLSASNSPEEQVRLQQELKSLDPEWRKKGFKSEVEQALADFKRIDSLNSESAWGAASDQYSTNLITDASGAFPNTDTAPSISEWTLDANWLPFKFGQSTGQIKLVGILRPWMNLNILVTQRWSWPNHGNFGDQVVVSDGRGLHSPIGSRTLMQVLPMQLVIGRNLSYSNEKIASDQMVFLGIICMVLPPLPGN